MRFMMLMIPEVYRKPTPPDFMPDMEAVKKMGKYNEELQKAGVLLGLDGLTPPSAAACISRRPRLSFIEPQSSLTHPPQG